MLSIITHLCVVIVVLIMVWAETELPLQFVVGVLVAILFGSIKNRKED